VAGFGAGVAEVECAPRLGLPLQGNFRDDYAARGVHDPLKAKAMVLESGGVRVAICAVDVCMLDASCVAVLRQAASEATEIPARHILVAATHTHSGPALTSLGAMPRSPEADIRTLLERSAQAVAAADRALAPAELAVGAAREERVSFNRRLRCRDGLTHMNWEGLDPAFVVSPLGPIDPELTLLAVGRGGKPAGALVNFPLHPAVLAGDNWLYSADYPGYLAEALGRLEGGAFVSIFVNGCCGNVNHIDYADRLQGRGYQMTQRIGYMLAAAAHEALASREAVRGAELGVASGRVELERIRIPEADFERARRALEGTDLGKTAGQVDGLPEAYYAHMLVKMHEAQDRRDPAELMCIRIGDAAVVGLPSEVFCELGMEVRRRSPARCTLVCELANDWFGYLPTRASFSEGGYEPSTGSTEFVPGSGERLVEEAVRLLEELFPRGGAL
jgi:neutral ceramidase